MQNYTKLHPTSLGLALGILWGLGMFFTGLFAMVLPNWGGEFFKAMGSIYFGFEATFFGALNGLFWGFIDAFVGGLIFAWLYNIFMGKFARKS